MARQAAAIMTHVQYAEMLIGETLRFNRRSKTAKKMRAALLLSALRELQAEVGKTVSDGKHPSK